MKVYTEARLLAVEHNSFKDNEGKTVEFYVNFLKDEDGVIKVNSSKDFSIQEGETGVARIFVREGADNRVKLSLKEFSTGETLDIPESVIE